MYCTYAIRITALTAVSFLFVGVAYAQEGDKGRAIPAVSEKINVQKIVNDRSDMEGGADDRSPSRSNTAVSKSDLLVGESENENTQIRERKRPGRITYGNITLERAFNADSPYPDEVQEVEARQKGFLFGLIPVQIPVVARVSKDEEIEVTQRPWYAFLLWR